MKIIAGLGFLLVAALSFSSCSTSGVATRGADGKSVLTECSACNSVISEFAVACPHCGHPRSVGVVLDAYRFVLAEEAAAADTPVLFKDARLETAVRVALEKPEGIVSRKDLASLEHLKANNAGIRDLTGLEYATKLQKLDLMINSISDLAPLANLGNLTKLWLWDNQISDLTPLANLTNLTILSLHENQIADVSPLAGLTDLTGLSLQDNRITDVLPLAELTKLTYLHLSNNRITEQQEALIRQVLPKCNIAFSPKED